MRLRDLSFTDLCLPGGRAPYLMGLPGRYDTPTTVSDPITLGDIDGLQTSCLRAAASDRLRVLWDSVPYRAQRIVHEGQTSWFLARAPHPPPALADLDIAPPLRATLQGLAADNRPGMLLITGPMRAGKSILAQAVFRRWISPGVGLSFADPAELLLEETSTEDTIIYQREIENEDWSTAQYEVLRTRCKALLISEIRSPASAATAIELATKALPVVTTMHATNITTALAQLARLIGPTPERGAEFVSEAVVAILNLRLTHDGKQWRYDIVPLIVDQAAREIIRASRPQLLADSILRSASLTNVTLTRKAA